MKNLTYFLLQAGVLAFMSQICYAQQETFLKDFTERFENSRKYVMAVAQAMPEKEYGFKPTPEIMSFREQLLHMGLGMDFHMNLIKTGKSEAKMERYKPDNQSKQEVINLLNQTFDEVSKEMNAFNPQSLNQQVTYEKFQRSKQQMFMALSEHLAHHRAETLVYLRLRGITPPIYGLYQ